MMDDNNGRNDNDVQFIQIQKVDGEYTRRQTRSLIFHLLYAMEAYGYDVSLEAVIDDFNRGFDQDIEYNGDIAKMTRAVAEKREELDEQLVPFLENWRLERLGVCTKIILRLALWEMLQGVTNTTIVINEAVELGKCFTEKDAFKFINGVLDRIADHLGKTDREEADELEGCESFEKDEESE